MNDSSVLQRRKQVARRLNGLIRAREESRGLLIAFEGPDGSGKTTQRKLFKGWLASEGVAVASTKWNSSLLIKPLVQSRKRAHALSPQEFTLIHASDYRFRLETEILPALWAGKTVVADRHFFTALARDAARGMDIHWLLNIYKPLFWPDIVFYFAVSPETSAQRIAADRDPTYYEAGQDITDLENPLESYAQFISRVIQEYEALALIFRFITLDAEQSIYQQHRLIRELYQVHERKPWSQGNREALLDWLVQNPALLEGKQDGKQVGTQK
jgi:dTMP kinase